MKKVKKVLSFTMAFLLIAAGVSFALQALAVSTMPSQGSASYCVVDISHHNTDNGGSINWPVLKQNVSAVYIKALEGESLYDPKAPSYASGAISVGLNYGFYEYFHPSTDLEYSRRQASNFYQFIENYGYSCVPVVDVEVPDGLGRNQIVSSLQAFLDEFKNISGGQQIMIYTAPSFIDENLDSSLANYKLWIAHYTDLDNPYDTTVWHSWTMWQSTDNAIIPGMPGPVDWSKATAGIFINTPNYLMNLDSPTENQNCIGKVDISGWALNRTGIKQVVIYMDGKEISRINGSDLAQRGDVQSNINSGNYYKDGSNSGFNTTVDTNLLSTGEHTYSVQAIGNDGSTQYSSRKIQVALPITNIDIPKGTTNDGDIAVSGWAVSRSGIKQVNVYIDNTSTPYTTINSSAMFSRPDVLKFLSDGNYKDIDKSCYYTIIPASTISAGAHTIYVAAVNYDDSVQWQNDPITVGPQPLSNIDSPQEKSSNGDLTVSGWAVNHSGIQKVDIYLDNQLTSTVNAADMTSRTDVLNSIKLSGYTSDTLNKNNAYSVTIPANKFKEGTHTVRVVATGNDNSTQEQTRQFTAASPVSCIDYPQEKTYNGDLTVSGWAENHSGVSQINIYVDDQLKKSIAAKDMSFRQDVVNAVSSIGYNGSTASNAYSATIQANQFKEGTHTVRVVAVGYDNSTQEQTRQFTAGPPAMSCIDYPQEKNYSGNVTVSGWAVNHSGVNKVDIYIDNQLRASIDGSKLTARQDVVNAVSSMGYDQSALNNAYSATITGDQFKAGTHTVRVVATGNDNSTQEQTRQFTVSPSVVCIDYPQEKNYSGNVTVSGWAVNHSGVNKVEIYIDNQLQASIDGSKLTARQDVVNAVSSMGYDQSALNNAYSATITGNQLQAGTHTVRVVATGNDNSTQEQTRQFTASPSVVCIDYPQEKNYSGNVTVSGWAVNHSGVNKVDIYIDNQLKASIDGSNLTARQDVVNAVSSIGYDRSALNNAYSATITGDQFKAGTHTIRVVATGNDNSTQEQTRQFTASPSVACIDFPEQKTYNGDVTVSGWAVNHSGIQQIDIYLDSTLVNSVPAKGLTFRLDVLRAVSSIGYNSSSLNSAYSTTITSGQISAGTHTITVRAIGNDNGDQTLSRQFTKQ